MNRLEALNLDDLVRASGFSKRQIRFYITKKLIPAAENRGPNAGYSEETLRRLLRIAELKRRRVGPTGRKLTLEEIRHELDNPPEVENTIAMLRRLPEDGPVESVSFLKETPETASAPDEPETVRESPLLPFLGRGPATGNPRFRAAAVDLLRRLASQLEEFVDHGLSPQQPDRPRGGTRTERWHRIAHLSLPDIEIHVRHPQHDDGRERMEAAARVLRELLETEDER